MHRWLIRVSMVLAISSCGPENGTPSTGARRDLSTGVGGGGGDDGGDDASPGGTDDAAIDDGSAAVPLDGPSAYDDLGKTDSGTCVPPNTGATCAAPIGPAAGCVTVEDCGPSGKGNGLDDNCNGVVDEGCTCTPGDVEPCFLGPPGKHKVGACTDGTQTCQGGEFGSWGACKGSIGPSPEVCDKLDNDCNGCADDGLCCDAVLACPASVPDAQPYTDIVYNGASYFKGAAASWSWTVDGGPCDQLFKTTTGSPPTQSYTFTNPTTAMPTLHTTLSGDYTITMTVVGTDGKTYSCKWVQHVVGPGVRFELCWDHTGSAPGGADLDLHVHRSGTTTKWFAVDSNPGTLANPDDCDYQNCKAGEYVGTPFAPIPNWGYANSPIAQCAGSPEGATWSSGLMACHNPRLDIDNISDVGRPENTNIDQPKNGDTFRALVHYYGQGGGMTSNAVEEHPMVNIYCGGRLTATYGQTPNTLGPCPGPTCFNTGAGWNAGQMWRVADVTAQVNAAGDTTGCTVSAIHPAGSNAGYYVTTNDTSY